MRGSRGQLPALPFRLRPPHEGSAAATAGFPLRSSETSGGSWRPSPKPSVTAQGLLQGGWSQSSAQHPAPDSLGSSAPAAQRPGPEARWHRYVHGRVTSPPCCQNPAGALERQLQTLSLERFITTLQPSWPAFLQAVKFMSAKLRLLSGQGWMGRDAAGGHCCATQNLIVYPDFESGPAGDVP